MPKPDYASAMAKAQEFESLIARYKSEDDALESHVLPRNWISKAEISFLDFNQAYEELFEIYKKFHQGEKAKKLLNDILVFVDSCDDFSYLIGLRLLLVVGRHITWLSKLQQDTKQLVKQRLENLIGRTIFNHFEPGFWIIAAKRSDQSALELSANDEDKTDIDAKQTADERRRNSRSALELLRDLSEEGEERAKVDRQLCSVMDLAARFNVAYQNLPMAEQWLRWAAEIAQDRLADKNLSGQFLEGASQIHRIYSRQPPSEAYLQALKTEANTPEYTEAMQQLSVVESLNIIIQKTLETLHEERFLAPLQELVTEYQNKVDTLEALATDTRFRLNIDWIKTKTESVKPKAKGQKTLITSLSAKDIDARDNPRQDMSPEESIEHGFTLQALQEIYRAVVHITSSSLTSGTITGENILARISGSSLIYDWAIYKVAIERFIAEDFISASHMLVPQFENIFREMLRANGIPVKRNVGGTSGDLPLNNLIEDIAVRDLVGFELAETIDWFMTRSYGPFSYRHKIAHGWINPRECNFALCSLAIWLTLTALTYVPAPTKDTDIDSQPAD